MTITSTKKIFEEDSYLKESSAEVVAVSPQGIILDQTIFYAESGGQPGDTGVLILENRDEISVVDTKYLPGRLRIIHILDAELESHYAESLIGQKVITKIDWQRRYQHMKMHSALHILCGIVPYPVTGCAIHDSHARLDFDAEQPFDKEEITEKLMAVINADLPLKVDYVTEQQIKDQQDLVRTVSAAVPEQGGAVRMINITDTDYQPCGGTHVSSTAEIGDVMVNKIKKKSKRNRRVNIVFS